MISFIRHHDFHPANLMLNSDNQLVVIDMMNICKGPAIYDVARTYYLLGNDRKVQEQYLNLMGYEAKDLNSYLEVISLTRENELKGK